MKQCRKIPNTWQERLNVHVFNISQITFLANLVENLFLNVGGSAGVEDGDKCFYYIGKNRLVKIPKETGKKEEE